VAILKPVRDGAVREYDAIAHLVGAGLEPQHAVEIPPAANDAGHVQTSQNDYRSNRSEEQRGQRDADPNLVRTPFTPCAGADPTDDREHAGGSE
jgi:hypothetical protein